MRAQLAELCDAVQLKGGVEWSCYPPRELCENLIARGNWPFPPIENVVEAPVHYVALNSSSPVARYRFLDTPPGLEPLTKQGEPNHLAMDLSHRGASVRRRMKVCTEGQR